MQIFIAMQSTLTENIEGKRYVNQNKSVPGFIDSKKGDISFGFSSCIFNALTKFVSVFARVM